MKRLSVFGLAFVALLSVVSAAEVEVYFSPNGGCENAIIEEINAAKSSISESAELHITGLPLIASLPLNQNLTPYFMYRHELISDGFLPDDFDDPRSTFVLGMEINLQKPGPKRWMPKVGLSIGTFNSLTGCEGDRGLILNLGLAIDSPPKRR